MQILNYIYFLFNSSIKEMLDSETRRRFSIRSSSKGNQICIVTTSFVKDLLTAWYTGTAKSALLATWAVSKFYFCMFVFILDLGSNVTMLKCFEYNPAWQPNLHNEPLDSH